MREEAFKIIKELWVRGFVYILEVLQKHILNDRRVLFPLVRMILEAVDGIYPFSNGRGHVKEFCI